MYAKLDKVYYLSLFCNCFCLLLYFGKVGGKYKPFVYYNGIEKVQFYSGKIIIVSLNCNSSHHCVLKWHQNCDLLFAVKVQRNPFVRRVALRVHRVLMMADFTRPVHIRPMALSAKSRLIKLIL